VPLIMKSQRNAEVRKAIEGDNSGGGRELVWLGGGGLPSTNIGSPNG